MRYLLVVFVLFSTNIFAHQNSFGVGVVNSTNIYKEQKNKTTPIPILNYTKENFYIKGLELGYRYNHFMALIAQPRMANDTPKETNDRHSTLETGVKITYPIKEYKLTFKTLFDTLGVHNSYNSSLKLSKTYVNLPFIFIPNIGIEYLDQKMSNYYYGVSNSSKYNDYKAKKAFNKTAGFVCVYNINKNYSFNLIYNYTKLDTTIKNSSIVEKNNKQTSIFSVVYKF